MRSFLAAFTLCLTFGLAGCDTPAEKKVDTPPVTPGPGPGPVTPPDKAPEPPKDGGGKMEGPAPVTPPVTTPPPTAPDKPADPPKP